MVVILAVGFGVGCLVQMNDLALLVGAATRLRGLVRQNGGSAGLPFGCACAVGYLVKPE